MSLTAQRPALLSQNLCLLRNWLFGGLTAYSVYWHDPAVITGLSFLLALGTTYCIDETLVAVFTALVMMIQKRGGA
jgi:hypothetical protein